MPMCGFNKEMLDGLKALNEGLVETLLDQQQEQVLLEENKNALLRI